MTILWLTLIFVFSVSLTARYFSVPALVSPSTIIPNRFLVMIAALALAMVSGLRSNIGDTFFYMHSYTIGDFSWQAVATSDDIGFNIFQMLLKQLSDDPQILVLTTGIITNLLIVWVLYNYTRLFELSVFLYITTGTFTVSMNGIRQFLAASIVFAATKFLLEGKWKSYLSIVVFASFFHQSALIMIPMYFIVRRKAWTKTTAMLLALAVIIVMGFSKFSELLFTVIKDTQYGSYESFDEGGANILRALVWIIPIIIAYFGRDKLRVLFPKSDIIVNISLIGVILMIISTQNWIFARMAIYFNLYQLILIAWLIKVFREKDQKLIYLIILCFYLLFYFYESVIALDLQYRSNYLIWPF
ncbi:capsular biosynthesis protein [Paenibacillus sp. FSL H8-0548]|uniref:EpsG family protein n=1 Tax=Paenibacillus sp. FSL H8-0548 TaxID=1920422 RepID=UPI00096E8B84|nr:EpsG family protein [Paenibacillus sp. FSL H8-0548]OMF35949.1 capsular biosynthesis protein [Paenibacillus sp. FSL H8-0548]